MNGTKKKQKQGKQKILCLGHRLNVLLSVTNQYHKKRFFMFCYGIAKMCIHFIHGAAEVVGVEGYGYVNGNGGR